MHAFGTRSVRKGWCRAMVGLCVLAFVLAVSVAVAALMPSSVATVVSATHQEPRVHTRTAHAPSSDHDTTMFFFSTRCRFCVDMKKIVQKALRIVGREQVRFVEVNVDNDQSLAEAYNVSGVPTLVYVSGKTGKVLDRMQGGGKGLNAVVDFMYGPAN